MTNLHVAMKCCNEMLQIVKLEHTNREYTGRRTYIRYNYIERENAPSFTASVGLAQARPNDIVASDGLRP